MTLSRPISLLGRDDLAAADAMADVDVRAASAVALIRVAPCLRATFLAKIEPMRNLVLSATENKVRGSGSRQRNSNMKLLSTVMSAVALALTAVSAHGEAAAQVPKKEQVAEAMQLVPHTEGACTATWCQKHVVLAPALPPNAAVTRVEYVVTGYSSGQPEVVQLNQNLAWAQFANLAPDRKSVQFWNQSEDHARRAWFRVWYTQ